MTADTSTSRPTSQAAEREGDAALLAGAFDAAVEAYTRALEGLRPSRRRTALQDKLRRAEDGACFGVGARDAQAEIYQRLFDPDYVLEGPHPGEVDTAPPDLTVPRSPLESATHRARTVAGRLAGSVGSFTVQQLTRAAGRAGATGDVWTNWYTTGTSLPKSLGRMTQVLKLAYMRETLFANNLVRTYPADAKTGFVEPPAAPPEWALRWRTADGSWNDLDRDADGRYDPLVGAAYTRFFRNVGDDRGIDAVYPREDPATDPVSVRDVSRAVFAPQGERTLVPFLNLWAAVWIQFMNHGWVSHGTTTTDRVDSLPLAEDDPLREYGMDRLDFRTTRPDFTRQEREEGMPPTFLNEVSHWWDGSQIYGSDPETQARLRSFRGGRLLVDDDGLLPTDPRSGTELTGFSRNWWVALGVLHTLFVREHNAIADALAEAYPDWDDEALFQTARLINGAVMAKIHTIEWTPALLPNETLEAGMAGNWYGLFTNMFGGERKRVLEDIPIGNRELGGAVGNPKGRFAKYALSEEFTAVYRLHSLLPDSVRVFRHGEDTPVDDVPLMRTRHGASPKLIREYGIESLALSMGIQQPGALVPNNYPAALLDMSVPGEPVVDLGAIDLYRDRERGVPTFNQLRKELGLKRVPSFDALTDDTRVVETLRALYGVDEDGQDRIDDMDLLVGTLCEGHRPTNFGFGETLFQVFILNASWRLIGDRFFTDDFREEVYTREGLDWIDDATMKSVLLRHFPSLADTGLANVRNAFEPWDAGPLEPGRHPLREFDKTIKGDPWAGDAPRARQTGG